MNEELSDWDSLSDSAAQDPPATLETLESKEVKNLKSDDRRQGPQKPPDGSFARPSMAYQPALSSQDLLPS